MCEFCALDFFSFVFLSGCGTYGCKCSGNAVAGGGDGGARGERQDEPGKCVEVLLLVVGGNGGRRLHRQRIELEHIEDAAAREQNVRRARDQDFFRLKRKI